jgi:hypothetical protein
MVASLLEKLISISLFLSFEMPNLWFTFGLMINRNKLVHQEWRAHETIAPLTPPHPLRFQNVGRSVRQEPMNQFWGGIKG